MRSYFSTATRTGGSHRKMHSGTASMKTVGAAGHAAAVRTSPALVKPVLFMLCLGLAAIGLVMTHLFVSNLKLQEMQRQEVCIKQNQKPMLQQQRLDLQHSQQQKPVPEQPTLQHKEHQHTKVFISPSRRTGVFFMKTHKTASSAIQNIFLRRALTDHLTIPIGKGDWARLCYPRLYSRSCPYNSDDGPFDMILQHLRYNADEVKASLKSNAVYVTILRHPYTFIPSAYKYFGWNKEYKSIEVFAEEYPNLANKKANGIPYRNLMLYDLGLEVSKFDDERLVDALICHIEETFHVVMFQERLMESLVLLRHALGWSQEDVAVFSINKQSSHAQAANNHTRDQIRQWNQQDIRLYDTLYEQFNRRVEEFGVERMSEEVMQLEGVIGELYRRCVESVKEEVGRFGKLMKLVLTPEGHTDQLCVYLTSSELDLLKMLKIRSMRGSNLKTKQQTRKKDNKISQQAVSVNIPFHYLVILCILIFLYLQR